MGGTSTGIREESRELIKRGRERNWRIIRSPGLLKLEGGGEWGYEFEFY